MELLRVMRCGNMKGKEFGVGKKNKSYIEEFFEFGSKRDDWFYGYVFIDFDNIYSGVIDIIPDLFKKEENDKEKLDKIYYWLDKIIDAIIKHYKNEKIYIRGIVAYANFNSLPYSNKLNIIDYLHKNGIKTVFPYIRNNKDMSDRALIIGVIEEIFFNPVYIDYIILLTGDIDYLPLLDFINSKTDKFIELISFENRFNSAYKNIYYLKGKIKFIDELIGINSRDSEDKKYIRILKDFLEAKKLNISEGINFEKTIRNLNNYYIYKFDNEKLKQCIEKIKNENT